MTGAGFGRRMWGTRGERKGGGAVGVGGGGGGGEGGGEDGRNESVKRSGLIGV